jgi:hypothetical protein
MTRKGVIHAFHNDPDSLSTGSHVAERIRQVKAEHGVELELYLFGPAERALEGDVNVVHKQAIKDLIKADVPAHSCIGFANAMGKAEEFAAMGLGLEYARDAFVRFAFEGATVINF